MPRPTPLDLVPITMAPTTTSASSANIKPSTVFSLGVGLRGRRAVGFDEGFDDCAEASRTVLQLVLRQGCPRGVVVLRRHRLQRVAQVVRSAAARSSTADAKRPSVTVCSAATAPWYSSAIFAASAAVVCSGSTAATLARLSTTLANTVQSDRSACLPHAAGTVTATVSEDAHGESSAHGAPPGQRTTCHAVHA